MHQGSICLCAVFGWAVIFSFPVQAHSLSVPGIHLLNDMSAPTAAERCHHCDLGLDITGGRGLCRINVDSGRTSAVGPTMRPVDAVTAVKSGIDAAACGISTRDRNRNHLNGSFLWDPIPPSDPAPLGKPAGPWHLLLRPDPPGHRWATSEPGTLFVSFLPCVEHSLFGTAPASSVDVHVRLGTDTQ